MFVDPHASPPLIHHRLHVSACTSLTYLSVTAVRHERQTEAALHASRGARCKMILASISLHIMCTMHGYEYMSPCGRNKYFLSPHSLQHTLIVLHACVCARMPRIERISEHEIFASLCTCMRTQKFTSPTHLRISFSASPMHLGNRAQTHGRGPFEHKPGHVFRHTKSAHVFICEKHPMSRRRRMLPPHLVWSGRQGMDLTVECHPCGRLRGMR